jgi:hypothetical protein
MYTLLPIVQLWMVALLIPAGLVTPPKKDTSLPNAPSFTEPEKCVNFTFVGSKPSATSTFDQSEQLQPCSVSRAVSSEDNGRNSVAIFFSCFLPHQHRQFTVWFFSPRDNLRFYNKPNLALVFIAEQVCLVKRFPESPGGTPPGGTPLGIGIGFTIVMAKSGDFVQNSPG